MFVDVFGWFVGCCLVLGVVVVVGVFCVLVLMWVFYLLVRGAWFVFWCLFFGVVVFCNNIYKGSLHFFF